MDPESYHFFGNLHLPPPENWLSPSSLQRLRDLEPCIADLEQRKRRKDASDWHYQERFPDAVKKEVACWKKLGVERQPEFALPPHGDLQAAVACHLHNPSFSVKDPYSPWTGDATNSSIAQIMLVGFKPGESCLLYDHLFRREASDGFKKYPAQVLEIHETFTTNLRANMGAVVDICWGSAVKKRMLRTLELEPLQLWGEFSQVQIFLEWKHLPREMPNNRQLVRFVVFVAHPEAMIYATRTTLGRRQDLCLTAASQIGGLFIDEQFYEVTHNRGTYGKLLKPEWAIQKMLNIQSCEQLGQATPDGNSKGNKPERSAPKSILDLIGSYTPGLEAVFDTEDGVEDTGIHEQNVVSEQSDDSTPQPIMSIHPDVKALVSGAQGLQYLLTALVDDTFSANDALNLCSSAASDEFDVMGVSQWEDIPIRLRNWLGAQDGLKIGGKSPSSWDELLRCRQLLARKPWKLQIESEIGVMGVIIDIAIRFYKQICRINQDMSSLSGLTISGQYPIPRKCGHCGSQILDDAFPRFKKLDPERYVATFLKQGCGANGCSPPSDCVRAIPLDDGMKWQAADKDALRRPPRKAGWNDILLLSKDGAQRLGLPREIECRCRGCGQARATDMSPRWTIESPPRYVPFRPRCGICNLRTITWEPISPAGIQWLNGASLSGLWKRAQKNGWSPDMIVTNPEIYFPRSTSSDPLPAP